MKLTSDNVDTVFRDCLSRKVEGATLVEGIVQPIAFDAAKLEKRRVDIQSMIDDVPEVFFRHSGGGMSFLNLCQDRNDVQWTGMQMLMGALVAMGIAIDRAAYLLPRNFWSVLPGGVPYVMFLHSSDLDPLPNPVPEAEPSSISEEKPEPEAA